MREQGEKQDAEMVSEAPLSSDLGGVATEEEERGASEQHPHSQSQHSPRSQHSPHSPHSTSKEPVLSPLSPTADPRRSILQREEAEADLAPAAEEGEEEEEGAMMTDSASPAGSRSVSAENRRSGTPQTPKTPEGQQQQQTAPDQWDTFVNAHKTRSLQVSQRPSEAPLHTSMSPDICGGVLVPQDLPEFSTPRSSWTHPQASPVAACALPISCLPATRGSARVSDSVECTPNCTKPVNAFAMLRTTRETTRSNAREEEPARSRCAMSSTSPALPTRQHPSTHQIHHAPLALSSPTQEDTV
eukprot:3378329-Rhodomonas_salina.1